MKKSTFITTLTFAFIMLISTNLNAQKFASLDKSPMDCASFPTSYKDSSSFDRVEIQSDTGSIQLIEIEQL